MRRGARWLTALATATLASLALAVPAYAHPLGNFTINHYSRVQLVGNQARVLYALDFAEIPTFQEKQRITDDPGYLDRTIRGYARGLSLVVDGQSVVLRTASHSMQFLSGQGGLETTRLEISLTSAALPSGTHVGRYRDANFAGRLGWKEVIVQSSNGARLDSSSAPGASVSQELRHYPGDMLASPLNVTEASFRFAPGPGAPAPTTGATSVSTVSRGALGLAQDRFAALIAPPDLTLPLIGLSMLIALVLGGLHALSPGHGKAVMAGYLVGSRGTRRHAVILGLTITVTHTAGVFALGLVTLFAAQLITPERLYPWLTLLSGLMILAIGGVLILTRTRAAFGRRTHHHDHDHERGRAPRPLGVRSLVALGISGGLIPCPSALVVLLAALSLHRVAFGMLLILGYSIGLSIVLAGIGVALASGTALVGRLRPAFAMGGIKRLGALVPVASALVVAVAGMALTAQAVPGIR